MISVITLGRQRALTAIRRYYVLKNKLSDRMIKQLLNSVLAKNRDLSVSRRSIICLSLRLRQIIDLPATDKSRYFAQPRPIIANYSLRTLPELPLLTFFYRNVLSAWKSISNHTARTQNEIKNEILWNNHEVTIGGKSVFYKQWYDADVKNILNKEGKFLKLLIFYPSLNAVTNVLCFIGLCNTIPKHWRNVFRRDNENDLVVSDESVHPFKNSRPTCRQSRAFYVS